MKNQIMSLTLSAIDINLLSDVYVVVSLHHYGHRDHLKQISKKTKVVCNRGTYPVDFMVDDVSLLDRLCLEFKLVTSGLLGLGYKTIAKAQVSEYVKELFHSSTGQRTLQLTEQSSGKPKGELSFSFKFGPAPTCTPETHDV